MKRLTLFRHAKSGWDDPAARDFDRALNGKGRRAARLIGTHLHESGLSFDRVAASPAVRCAETLDAMFGGYGRRVATTWDKRIYLASDATLVEVLHDTPDTIDHLLLCGHNPGMEDLALLLVPDDGDPLRDTLEAKFPTASVATIELDMDGWAAVRRRTGRLVAFTRPRDLDPELGPEE